MKLNEPKWPTAEDAKIDAPEDEGGPQPWGMVYQQAIQAGIDLAKEAYRLWADDPAKSPIGEIREIPFNHCFYDGVGGEHFGGKVIRFDHYTKACHPGAPYQWVCISTKGEITNFVGPEVVRGWKIVGAVPGTRAWEKQNG